MTALTSMEQIEAFLAAFADEVSSQVAAKLAAEQPVTQRLLTSEEAGVMLGVSERAVRTLIAGDDPAIPSVVVGKGAKRIELAAVEAYIASLRGGR